jgi:hypothetical protein
LLAKVSTSDWVEAKSRGGPITRAARTSSDTPSPLAHIHATPAAISADFLAAKKLIAERRGLDLGRAGDPETRLVEL